MTDAEMAAALRANGWRVGKQRWDDEFQLLVGDTWAVLDTASPRLRITSKFEDSVFLETERGEACVASHRELADWARKTGARPLP